MQIFHEYMRFCVSNLSEKFNDYNIDISIYFVLDIFRVNPETKSHDKRTDRYVSRACFFKVILRSLLIENFLYLHNIRQTTPRRPTVLKNYL